MRNLKVAELKTISGGSSKWQKVGAADRAAPAQDVTPDLTGNRTGWCRGYGNMKNHQHKHVGASCGCDLPVLETVPGPELALT